MDQPFFNIVANVDVSRLFQKARDEERSFFLSCAYYSLKVVNQIKEFKFRMVDDKVLHYHTINGSSTALRPNETFQYCYFDYMEDIQDFETAAQKNIAEQIQSEGLLLSNRKDMIYYSCIPWVSFSSFQHARSFDNGDSIPRIVFGKAQKVQEHRTMPVSVEVNHALVDGLHVGRFFEQFSQEISQL